MKFSIFFEMQISGPNPAKERQCFHDCVEQAVFADQLGYHCIWAVEHHGLLEYSHSSAPEVFLSYVAAKTHRIRLGHGVTLTPYRYNHPIRIAERIATLDILSQGRVNWGSGKSSSLVEQIGFENDIAELNSQWQEAVHMVPRMWQEDVFEYQGRHYNIPPIQVIPKPVQTPHPPIFAACSKPDSAKLVGEMGLGALNFAVGSDAYLKKKVDDYKNAVKQAKPKDYHVTNHFAATPVCCVLEDDKKACEYGLRGLRFFAESLATYYFSDHRPTGSLDVARDFMTEPQFAEAIKFRDDPNFGASAIIGDPVHARELVGRFADCGVDELILAMQVGTVPHEITMQSLQIFAQQVMPHFAGPNHHQPTGLATTVESDGTKASNTCNESTQGSPSLAHLS